MLSSVSPRFGGFVTYQPGMDRKKAEQVLHLTQKTLVDHEQDVLAIELEDQEAPQVPPEDAVFYAETEDAQSFLESALRTAVRDYGRSGLVVPVSSSFEKAELLSLYPMLVALESLMTTEKNRLHRESLGSFKIEEVLRGWQADIIGEFSGGVQEGPLIETSSGTCGPQPRYPMPKPEFDWVDKA